MEELKRLQQDYSRLHMELRRSKMMLDSNVSTKRRSELTLNEVSALASDTRTFKGVGRTFFLTPKSEIEKEIKEVITSCEQNVLALEKKQQTCHEELEQTVSSLQEISTE